MMLLIGCLFSGHGQLDLSTICLAFTALTSRCRVSGLNMMSLISNWLMHDEGGLRDILIMLGCRR